MFLNKNNAKFERRKNRSRYNISKRSDLLRLCVSKSNVNIYAQIIDDKKGETLVSCSTLAKPFKEKHGDVLKGKEAAALVGTMLAELAKDKQIEEVVLDRSAYKYHGRIKALAMAADQNGLRCISKRNKNTNNEVANGI